MFYSNKADLTPQGQEIIGGVSHVQAHQTDQFDVIDDANFSVISDYDRALSYRRAKVVVALLVADGVPKSRIKIYYEDIFHSAWSAVQDTHEPQNRHVVVFLPCSPPPPGVVEVP